MLNYQGLLAIIVSIILGCNQTEQTTKPDDDVILSEDSSCIDWAEFTVNDLIISNNVWGKGTETNYEQCIYYKSNNTQTEIGWNWDWPGTGDVRAYPEIIFGLKPWSTESTSPLLPAQINSNSIILKFTGTAKAIGQWNLAYDIWLTNSKTPTAENVTHEIMIWMHKTNSITPAGTFRETITINGNNFALWVNENHNDSWTYIAFVTDTTKLSVSLDLNAFIDYLITNSYVSPNLFISGIEFGTEIFEGKGNVVLSEYEVEVQ
ncbi:MAG: hypothetical protein P8X73_05315 [Ignavibacteriaceae bacterium]